MKQTRRQRRRIARRAALRACRGIMSLQSRKRRKKLDLFATRTVWHLTTITAFLLLILQ